VRQFIYERFQTLSIVIDEARISDIVRGETEIRSAMENGYSKAAVSPFEKIASVWGIIKANR